LKLEENLKVIIESKNVFPDHRLENDPSFGVHYKYARHIHERYNFQQFPFIDSFIKGAAFTFFVELFHYLLKENCLPTDEEPVEYVGKQFYEIEEALRESQIHAETDSIAVIGAMSYYKLTNNDKYLHFVNWVKRNKIGDIGQLHIGDVIKIYDKIYINCPRKIFLARWYPPEDSPDYKNAKLRLEAFKATVEQLGLELVDMGTKDTGTFDIRTVMYSEIEKCDIFVADLTGARHNVMVEVGYHLRRHTEGRMVFYFQKSALTDKVPFDLSGFMYKEISDSADIPNEVKPLLEKMLERIKSGEI
jgi:hypothetical protein